MVNRKQKRRYICPYCAQTFENSKWTYDHIIPLNIGGPKMFKIVSCSACNNRISREIEQPAMHTEPIWGAHGYMLRKGFKIKTRRRKGLQPLSKEIGMSFGKRVKFYRDMDTGQLHLTFLDGNPPKHLLERNAGVAIFPVDEETENEKMLSVRLVAKIVLGTFCWLWGNELTKSDGCRELRQDLWNMDYESILELNETDKHFGLKTENGFDHQDEIVIDEDAMDNHPHHTIFIFSNKGFLWTLVNLFGSYESLRIVRDSSLTSLIPEQDAGIVMVVKTTENSVTRMKLEEYLSVKSKYYGKRVDLSG